ncbi:major capsid protein [Saccharopolyspora tripterygii]
MAGAQLWQMEEFAPPVFLDFVRNLLPPPAYQGATWLPNQTIDDIEYEYIKGQNDAPVMAHIIGWDSEAPIAGRPALGERVRGELPPIKRKTRISEKEILRFLNPRRGTADQQSALRAVYNDTSRLVASIQARMEWLRMQALSEDTVRYNEGGVIIEFDFGVPDAQQIVLGSAAGAATDDTGATQGAYGPVWSDVANATPLTDLITMSDQIEQATGERPSTMVMSRKAHNNLLVNGQIKGWTYAQYAPDRPMQPEEVNQTLDRYGLPRPVIYDVKVGSENADGTSTQVRTMRENQVVLLPAQPVGRTLWGPTAESIRTLNGTQYSAQAPGIWASTYYQDEPPSEWTKAVAAAFPSLPNVDRLGQLQVMA